MITTTRRPPDQTREQPYRDVRASASGLNQFMPVIVPQPGLCMTLPVWSRAICGSR